MKYVLITGACKNTGVSVTEKFAAAGCDFLHSVGSIACLAYAIGKDERVEDGQNTGSDRYKHQRVH